MVFNITIINVMVIKSPHDIWNHRNNFGRRCPGFEVIFYRLDVPLYCWLILFITMKGVELIHIYSNNWWKEVRATDDSGIKPVSNYSTVFAKNLPSKTENFNKWMGSCCIIVGGIQRTKLVISTTWSGQCIWGSNNL